jgi:hypothetical protein
VTGVTASVPPSLVGKVNVSGTYPVVRSVNGVGDGEYGTSGSTDVVALEATLVPVEAGGDVVSLVQATAASRARHATEEWSERMGTRRV